MDTKEYYKKIASEMEFDTDPFIDGKSVRGSGPAFESIDPATGEVLATLSSNTAEEVYEAEKAARRAFDDKRWRGLAPAERKEILFGLADLLMEHCEELAVMESLDAGKPITDNYEDDIPEAADTLRFQAEAIDKLEDAVTAGDPEHLSLVVREPLGVVGAITPWNFPLGEAVIKAAPALAAGNSVVLKPSSLTPFTTIKLAKLASQAGMPDGVFNVVLGSGSVVGGAMGKHPEMEGLTFTGSTDVGKKLLIQAGETNAKRIFLEMGGKSPFIVMPDVKDLEHAADEAIGAAFWNMGENCTANSRIMLHKDIKEEFTEIFLEKVAEMSTGDPLDPDNDMGALIEKAHMEKVLGYIETGKKEGAKILCGGGQILKESGGNFIEPTVFDGLTPDMTIAKDEIFGPVTGLMTFETEEEAVKIANDTRYGLQATVFTDDLSTAHRMSRELRAGNVSVNCYSEGDLGTPFGGYKQSGFFGRENSVWALRQYMELKTVWIEL